MPATERVFLRSHGWTRITSTRFVGGKALRATRKGATLTLRGIHALAIDVLVSTGPGMGKITATWNGTSLDTWDLALDEEWEPLTSRQDRVWLTIMEPWGERGSTGTLVLRVASSGKPVMVDGIRVDPR